MNLFAVSKDPYECAVTLDDKRLGKICLESAQIISTVMALQNREGPYKATHTNHPIVLWANDDDRNFSWVVKYNHALGIEFFLRFNKPHASYLAIQKQEIITTDQPPRSFVNCARNKEFELDFTWDSDVHRAYRRYLAVRWTKTDIKEPRWSNSMPPRWFKHGINLW